MKILLTAAAATILAGGACDLVGRSSAAGACFIAAEVLLGLAANRVSTELKIRLTLALMCALGAVCLATWECAK